MEVADVAETDGSRCIVDLRSDTVTRPTREMRAEMASARVGDDVYGEDPTVQTLEQKGAAMFGKERGLFVPTGVMANQLAIRVQTEPGDEVIVGERSHIFHYETAAPSVLSGVQLYTVPDPLGRIEIESIAEATREDVYYMPRTAVIAQENTHNKTSGRITNVDHLRQIREYAVEKGIGVHLDGARIWNAGVASRTPFEEYGRICDTMSVCLSKGLGAPVGSLFLGTSDQVARAWRFRKMWGGGWRQAGILAAAGLYALDHHIDRMAEDHTRAREFHQVIATSAYIDAGDEPESNIVVFRVAEKHIPELVDECRRNDVLISAAFRGALRAVFHYDVNRDQVARAAELIAAWEPEAE